jgi:dolichyl-phosphate-mannose--protein O-mannosyl transferase
MTTPAPVSEQHHGHRSSGGAWSGWIVFASTLMLILGCFHAIAGFVGIFDEDYYQVGESGLVVTVDYTTWGWTHLLLGILVVLAGAALLRGATWARVVAILLAVVSAIANLAFMPAYPLWSLIMVILNVLVIYAVTAHGDRESLGAY